MFTEILFKMLLFREGVLIYAEHCISFFKSGDLRVFYVTLENKTSHKGHIFNSESY